MNAQKPFSAAHLVHEVDDVVDVLVVVLLDVPPPYQQLFSYPYAGSVWETTPLVQLTLLVNGPLSVYLRGLAVPKTTFALPGNEQTSPSDAQRV